MWRSSFPITLAFACLLAPAGFMAWFHHACFPAVLAGTRHLWGGQKPFPTGFEFLCEFGFVAYLPLLLIVSGAVLSWRFPVFRSTLCFASYGGVLATVCAVYAMLLSMPALAHGLSI